LFENKINICTTIRLIAFVQYIKKIVLTKLNKNIITIHVIYSRKNYFKEYFNYFKDIIGKRLSTGNNFVKKANKMFYITVYNKLTFITTYS